jgi:hypothetical protein
VLRISVNTIQKIKQAKLSGFKKEPDRYEFASILIKELTERANKGIKDYENSLEYGNTKELEINNQKALGFVFIINFLNHMIPFVWKELLHHFKLTERTTEGKEVQPTKKTPKAKKEYADYIDAFVMNYNAEKGARLNSKNSHEPFLMTSSKFINMAEEERLLTMEDIKQLTDAIVKIEEQWN